MSNHVNRFHAAVKALAGHGHIKQRLIQAFEENLAGIDEVDLPHAVTKSFANLAKMMSQVDPLNGEGPICASVRKMSIQEADECAHQMIDIYGAMIRHADDTQELLPLPPQDQQQVPPFLVKSN